MVKVCSVVWLLAFVVGCSATAERVGTEADVDGGCVVSASSAKCSMCVGVADWDVVKVDGDVAVCVNERPYERCSGDSVNLRPYDANCKPPGCDAGVECAPQ